MKEKKKCLISIILLLIIQALLYYLTKLIQEPPHLIGTSFDKSFPFCKYFVFIYNSWYPFLIISWYILYKKDKLVYKRFYVASVISMLIANIIFIIYPSTIDRASFIVNDLASFILNITYMLDTPINCLPSMHCMFCFTTLYAITQSKLNFRSKLVIIIYLILIILSTLFIKQHVIYDVLLAFVISTICYYFISKLKVFNKLKEYL